MDKFKKIAAMVAAVILVMAVFPVSSFAGSASIGSARVMLDEPVAGENAGFSAGVRQGDNFFVSSVKWQNYTTGEYLGKGDTFEYGCEYVVEVLLKPGSGWKFDPAPQLIKQGESSINGYTLDSSDASVAGTGTISNKEQNTRLLIYHFPVLEDLNEPETPEEPQVIEEPEIPEEPQVVEEPETPEEPQVVEEPETPEEPQAVEEPEIPEEPQAVEEPEAPEEPEAIIEHITGSDPTPVVKPELTPSSNPEPVSEPVLTSEPVPEYITVVPEPAPVSVENVLVASKMTVAAPKTDTEVPDTDEETALDIKLWEDPELYADTLKTKLVETFSESGMEIMVYDVTLKVKNENGEWVEATVDNFPADGKLTVVLPYPEGTDKEHFKFYVGHMFTKDYFGKTPGDIEYPEARLTDEGVEFDVTGLSPIALGWLEVFESNSPKVVVTTIGPNGDTLDINDGETPGAAKPASKSFWYIFASLATLAFAAFVYILTDKYKQSKDK